jgi:hypothetical protein
VTGAELLGGCLDSKSCTREVVALEGVSSTAGDDATVSGPRRTPCNGEGRRDTGLGEDLGSREGVDLGVPDLEVASMAAV